MDSAALQQAVVQATWPAGQPPPGLPPPGQTQRWRTGTAAAHTPGRPDGPVPVANTRQPWLPASPAPGNREALSPAQYRHGPASDHNLRGAPESPSVQCALKIAGESGQMLPGGCESPRPPR